MKNLNELEKVIKEALNELRDLKAGCVFTRHNETYVILSEFKDASFKQRYIFESRNDFVYKTSNFRIGSAFHEQIAVIGQEIQLIHVLKWMKLIYPNKHDFWAQRFKLLEYWNLDENLLKNQSKELIDFLFNLIQN
jgi:hypothetical protein